MAADQTASSATSRQRIVGVAILLVVIFLIWQARGLFSGGKSAETITPPVTAVKAQPPTMPSTAQQPGGMPPQQNAAMPTPQPVAAVPNPPVMTAREAELLRLQQETEAKYIAALNELQLLRIDREIAETNKAIASAKLDMVTAQKNIVNLLSTPEVPNNVYTQSLIQPTTTTVVAPTGAPPTITVTAAPPEVSYTVISVTQIQYRWSAVLGYKGSLYSVHVGDILPADGSKVILINKSGVVLEKEGVKKKVSMVPVI